MLDFVEITKQASFGKPASSRRMNALLRRIELIKALLLQHEFADAALQALTDFLSLHYITCEQFCVLLSLFQESHPRTTLFVRAYARVIDWQNLMHVLQR